MGKWYCYILECMDKTFYTGITCDLERRVFEHNSGTASKYTRSRYPVKLVYASEYPDRSSASKEEFRIKKLTRTKKLVLINGDGHPI
jgi:putative endonuclease